MENSRAPDAILKHSSERVLLVGWDAADWKIILPLVEQGHMPHLQALMNRGVYGDLLTLQRVQMDGLHTNWRREFDHRIA